MTVNRFLEHLKSTIISLKKESRHFITNSNGKDYNSLVADVEKAYIELDHYIGTNYQLVEANVIPFLNSTENSIVKHDPFFNQLRHETKGAISITHWSYGTIGLLVRGQVIGVVEDRGKWRIINYDK